MKRSLRNTGSVLIIVLCISLGLVGVSLLFGHSMLMNYRGVDNDLAGRQAEQALDGAARYAQTLFIDSQTPGVFPEATTYDCEEMAIGEATCWMLGRPLSTGTGTALEFGLVDEASKLNLNTATQAMLLLLPGMTEELVAAIKDWRDADDDVSTGGAESSTYLAMQPSYSCKNGPFESIEELALVSGATREILYGEDANMNGFLDANEDDGSKSLPDDNSDGKLDAGVLEYLTVFTRESNKQADGTDRIDITAAPPNQPLTTLLNEKLGAERAQEVQNRLQQAASGPLRSVIEFYVRSGMKEDEFALVSDALTTSTQPFIEGRVNVNTASETVLACIPGIGTEKATALVSARLSRTADGSIAWVAETLKEGVAEAGRYLTGQSFQVSADVAAVGRLGRGYRRAKFVIDLSKDTPRIVYRRNLAPLGWALGSEIRQTFAMKKETR